MTISRFSTVGCLCLSLWLGFNHHVRAEDVTEKAYSLRITPTKEGTFGTARIDKDKVTALIGNSSGIGRVTLEPSNQIWPEHVTIKIAIKGLENFEISNGESTLTIAIPSDNPEAPIRQSISGKFPLVGSTPKNDQQPPVETTYESIDSNHELWASVRRCHPQCIRSPNDYSIEIDVPTPFLISQPKSLHVSWIDFYR